MAYPMVCEDRHRPGLNVHGRAQPKCPTFSCPLGLFVPQPGRKHKGLRASFTPPARQIHASAFCDCAYDSRRSPGSLVPPETSRLETLPRTVPEPPAAKPRPTRRRYGVMAFLCVLSFLTY